MVEIQKRYDALFQNMAQGVFFQEKSGALTDVNPAALEMFGLTRDQFLGRTSLHPDWRVIKEDGSDLLPEQHPSMVALRTGNEVKDFIAGVYNPLFKKVIWLNINAIPMFQVGENTPYQTFVTLHDISAQLKTRNIQQSRLNLLEFSQSHTLDEILVYTLDEVEKLTDSSIGFYHFCDDNTQGITLKAWSTRTFTLFGQIDSKEGHSPLKQVGGWIDCLREGQPVIHNDYQALSDCKGLPEGHSQIIRELVVPIKHQGKVVAILGVGNKSENYTEADIDTVMLFADMVWNIAERKRSEELLRQSEKRYRAITETSMDSYCVVDASSRKIVAANQAMTKIYGYGRDEILTKSLLDLEVIEDESLAKEHIEKVKTNNYDRFQSKHRLKDGQIIDVEVSVTYLSESDHLLCFVRDITAKKYAEEALREYQEKLDAALESMDDAVFISDAQGNFVNFNKAFATFHRFRNKAECTNRLADYPQILEAFLPNGEPVPLDQWAVSRALRGETATNFEYTVRRKDTGETWIGSCNFGPFFDQQGNIAGAVVVARDITEQKQIEEKLRFSEKRSLAYLENSPACTKILDQDFNLQYMSMAGIKGLNIDNIEDYYGKPYPFYFYPESFKKQMRGNLELAKETGDIITQEAAVVDVDGKEIWFHSTIVPVSNDEDDLDYFMVVSIDTTERKQAEEALKLERDSTRNILATVDAMIVALGPEGRITMVNRKACEILGYREDELLGQDWCSTCLPHSIDVDQVRAVFKMALAGNLAGSEYYENPVRTSSGEERLIAWHNSSIRDKDGNIIGGLSAGVDITERKQTQLALDKKNQELEQFVYSVSHDLKSPLVTVRTYTGMLRQDLLGTDHQQISEDLNYIDKAANKMQQLLDVLLQYSRIGKIDTPAQIQTALQLVNGSFDTLAGILREHQVEVSTSELPQQLHGDPLHFGQIWQNLIENAVKYRGEQAQLHIKIGATQEGKDVVFYVRDNGMGIAPEHGERIFNLFSQLNSGSEGSGLGLALVKKIVSIYQGRIWVESAGPGTGSCFMFTLPSALIKEDTTP